MKTSYIPRRQTCAHEPRRLLAVCFPPFVVLPSRRIEMTKSIALLAITLLMMASSEAQERTHNPCRLRFAVVEDSHRDHSGAWPEDAKKWWAKDGKKKFPGFCETTSHDADFVIAWLKKQSTETSSRPKLDGSWPRGSSPAFAAVDCYTSPGETMCSPGPDGQLTCSTTPPQTTCTTRYQPEAL